MALMLASLDAILLYTANPKLASPWVAWAISAMVFSVVGETFVKLVICVST